MRFRIHAMNLRFCLASLREKIGVENSSALPELIPL
jgi:hypothetical protein